MALEYTEEQLNSFDKKTLVQLFLVQQSQLKEIDTKLQLLLEQVAVLNQKRFGRSSEKLEADNNQMALIEVDGKIVFFNYQPSRNTSHPRKFLKDFQGVCVTDGYEIYHTLEKEREDLKVAGCWAHARRRFDEALKALPKANRKDALAYLALKQIQAIYREENKLADMTSEERLKHRQLTVKPLVDAYFAWVKENISKVTAKGKTHNGFSYSINQEKYLRVFLEDGEVPMDNNAAEQSI